MSTPDTPPSPTTAPVPVSARLAARRNRGAVPIGAHDDHRGLPGQHNGTLGTDPKRAVPPIRARTALGRRAALRDRMRQRDAVVAFSPDTGQAPA